MSARLCSIIETCLEKKITYAEVLIYFGLCREWLGVIGNGDRYFLKKLGCFKVAGNISQ